MKKKLIIRFLYTERWGKHRANNSYKCTGQGI